MIYIYIVRNVKSILHELQFLWKFCKVQQQFHLNSGLYCKIWTWIHTPELNGAMVQLAAIALTILNSCQQYQRKSSSCEYRTLGNLLNVNENIVKQSILKIWNFYGPIVSKQGKKSSGVATRKCSIYLGSIWEYRCTHKTQFNLTPWPESASELHQPSDRHLSEKLVPTFADRGCHVVRVMDPYGRIIGVLDRIRYLFFQVAPQLYSRGWVDPFPDPQLLRKSGSVWNRTRNSGSGARNSDR
jgi:hypothetical protein